MCWLLALRKSETPGACYTGETRTVNVEALLVRGRGSPRRPAAARPCGVDVLVAVPHGRRAESVEARGRRTRAADTMGGTGSLSGAVESSGRPGLSPEPPGPTEDGGKHGWSTYGVARRGRTGARRIRHRGQWRPRAGRRVEGGDGRGPHVVADVPARRRVPAHPPARSASRRRRRSSRRIGHRPRRPNPRRGPGRCRWLLRWCASDAQGAAVDRAMLRPGAGRVKRPEPGCGFALAGRS